MHKLLWKHWKHLNYTESTLHKLLCKSEDQVATEDKNNIAYKTTTGVTAEQSIVYSGKSKQSLKLRLDKQKRSVRNCDCEKMNLKNTVGKQIATLAGIRRRLLIGNTG